MQLPAVSIMHMYDEISQFFSENDLKKLGLEVEISQWQLEIEEALKDLENNPQAQTKLKRLHRGFDNMYRAWVNGELKNNHLAKILNDAADGQLFELWTTLSWTEADNKEFNIRVTEGYKKQLEELKGSWFTGQVDKEVKSALDLYIIRAFINEWDNPNITDEAIKTETMANAKIVFFSDLKSNKLSTLLGSKIESIKEGCWNLDGSICMYASKMVLQDWLTIDL